MAENAYLIYYARSLLDENYVAMFAIPREFIMDYRKLLDKLVEIGILSSYEFDPLIQVDFVQFNPKYYDFNFRSWKIDWRKIREEEPKIPPLNISDNIPTEIDLIDLLILDILQLDSTLSICDIARKLGIRHEVVRYHLIKHVIGKKLIAGYLVIWQGVDDEEKVKKRINMVIEVKKIDDNLLHVRKVVRKLPFIYFDAISDNNKYLAYIQVPIEALTSTLGYLREEFLNYNCKYNIKILDSTVAASYNVPCEMFDEENGWVFDSEVVFNRIEDIAAVISIAPEVFQRKK